MEGVKRTNVIMVCPNQRAEFVQYNSYTMNMNWENRNCYSCGRFEHLVRNCRNRRIRNRIGERRKLEYRQNNGQILMIEGKNGQSNLNGNRDLIVLD